MFERLHERREEHEGGFTLIELMVVVLIIGILVAIALPTFLGARTRAQDRAAESNLRNGIAAAKVFFTDNDVYTGFNATAAQAIEPSLTWVDGGAASQNQVHIHVVGASEVALGTQSASGTNLCVADLSAANGGTHEGKLDGQTYNACVGGW